MQAIGALSGRTLGDYQLGVPLGDDGFGPVYEALHLHLGRTFALRVLSDRFTFASGFEEHFQRVTQVLTTLEHSNLLTLDDHGIDGPFAYLVTPFVEGFTLEAWLRQHAGQATGPAQVTRLFGQALVACHAAHQAGVTHLGLTPRYIMLQPNGHLLVGSFGLPYLAEQLWIAWNSSRSFGDPLYLAPEQFPGRTPDGVASDIYALGIILYRLLTGVLPFEGPPQALLSAKLEGPPSLGAKLPTVPPALGEVIARALMPTPEERWPTIAAFGGAFYLALERSGQPVPPELSASFLNAAPSLRAGPASRPLSAPGTPQREGQAAPASEHPSPEGPSGNIWQHVAPPPSRSEPEAAVPWSSAGRGRAVPPPPPPGWRPGVYQQARQRVPPKQRSPLRRVVSTLAKIVFLLLTLAVLGIAIVYGYQHWQHPQPGATPTPTTPAGSPTSPASPTPHLNASLPTPPVLLE